MQADSFPSPPTIFEAERRRSSNVGSSNRKYLAIWRRAKQSDSPSSSYASSSASTSSSTSSNISVLFFLNDNYIIIIHNFHNFHNIHNIILVLLIRLFLNYTNIIIFFNVHNIL